MVLRVGPSLIPDSTLGCHLGLDGTTGHQEMMQQEVIEPLKRDLERREQQQPVQGEAVMGYCMMLEVLGSIEEKWVTSQVTH